MNLKRLKNLFIRKSKIGNHIFTFPDGARLYQLKEEYFETVQNHKLRIIQENSNYIAHLGVSKSTLEAGIENIKKMSHEASALNSMRKREDVTKKLDDLVKAIEFIDLTRKEYDGTQETIMVSLFDLFFYFDGENPYIQDPITLEKKRYYLNEYPYFRNFFFQKLNDYSEACKVTFKNSILFASAQTAIQEILKDSSLTNIKDSKTD